MSRIITSLVLLTIGLCATGCGQSAAPTAVAAPSQNTKSWAEQYQTALSIVEHEERLLEQLEPAMRSACRLCVSASDRGRDLLKTAVEHAKKAKELRNDTGIHADIHQQFAKLDDIQRDQSLGWLEDEVGKLVAQVKQRDEAAVRRRWAGWGGDFESIQQYWDQQDQLATAQQNVARLRRERP